MTNIFEETYEKVQEAKRAYDAAATEEEKEAAREAYKKAGESIKSKGEIIIWHAYEDSRDCGNEYLDFHDTIRDEEIESLVKTMKENGIRHFTFSSTWSSAVETAWLFQKNGCRLEGLVEINSQYKAAFSDEYEKAHGYLFGIE